MTDNPFPPYQTKVLFLLVGSNPLPNYVAARLLARENGTVVLLNSEKTSQVAERLKRQLAAERSDLSFQLYTVPESDGPSIARKVDEAARQFERFYPHMTIGLNYTGGTKPMAAYSYQILSKMFPRGVYSYLDARTLSMVLDPGGETMQRIRVESKVALKLKDIVELHGYQLKQPRRNSICTKIATAIAEVHQTIDGMNQWRSWLDTWSTGATLPNFAQFPALESIEKTFETVCGGESTENGVAQALGFQQLKQCSKYFIGGWLEDYTLDALAQANRQLQLDDYAGEINISAPQRPPFEIDAAATIGYQLFALSCIVTHKKGAAKEHLLEVVTRAGQLGGDEARFAAITFCDDKNVRELQLDVSEAWDAAGKIRVFGRSHIPNLSDHLLKWFREANQEAS